MYKEFRSHWYHPYNNKKAEETENQQLLYPSEDWGPRQTATLKTGDRWIQRITTHSWGQYPKSTYTIIDELLKAQYGLAWELKTQKMGSLGGADFPGFYV